MKQKLGMVCGVVLLGLMPSSGWAQNQNQKAVNATAPMPKTQTMETQAKDPKAAAVNSQITDKEYSMVELAPGKMVKKLNTAPAGTPGRVNPGSPVADSIVGTYDSKHNYSEKTPPAQAGDKKPQMGINPGELNQKYQEKGKVMTPQAPATKPQMKNP